MNILLIILVILVVLVTLVVFVSRFAPVTETKENEFLYKKRYRVMNDSESSFFHLLQKHIPTGHYIFPKMRIADIIETRSGKGYYKQRNKILPKHVDFVVCNEKLEPVVAIEIDGKSHNQSDRMERDRQVDEIFKSVSLPLEHVKVGVDFESRCKEIILLLA